MQAPVPRASECRRRGEAGTVQKEQQRDGQRGDVAGHDCSDTMRRHHRGQTDHTDDGGDVEVDRQPGQQRLAGHRSILSSCAMQQPIADPGYCEPASTALL